MKQLRHLSARPELVVGSPTPNPIGDATTQVGVSGPLGRGRLVEALRTNKTGPVQLQAARVIQGSDVCYVGDSSGNLIGDLKAVWVNRLVTATKTSNTRRL